MNLFDSILVSGAIALILVSGCLSTQTEFGDDFPKGRLTVSGGSEKNTEISILNVSTDKALYHSAEVLNLNIIVNSNEDVENVSAKASGINGRMNLEKTVSLKKGENLVSFTYTLPRCNVCGGISAGTYEISCGVYYNNISVQNSTNVQIVQ